MLGKVKQLEKSRAADLVLIDAPAAGHAVSFLLSARGLLDAVQVGPIRKQASDVVELLSDPARCQVMLVTVPEETPVSELVETAFAIEDRAGVALGPVVVNGCVPSDRRAARRSGAPRRRGRRRRGDPGRGRRVSVSTSKRASVEQQARLAELLPLPQITLPFLFTAGIGPRRDRGARRRVRGGRRRARAGRQRDRRRGRRTRTADDRVGGRRRTASSCAAARAASGRRPRAAALAIQGARRGRRAVVVTIDPAKRLAQALGLEHLSNAAHEIDRARWDPDGSATPGGSLSALMLDAKSTFDTLVRQYAHDDAQAERILGNAFYRNIAGSLVGHAGVHGDGEALRAARRRRLRPHRRRHPADPPRARLPRRAAAPHPPARQPDLPSADDARAGRVPRRLGRGAGVPPRRRTRRRHRGDRRRARVLPCVRGNGGGLPHARERDDGAAGVRRHRVRARHVTAPRRRRRGRVLRGTPRGGRASR